MTNADIVAVYVLVTQLWPNARWPQPLQQRFVDDLRKLPLDAAQVKAALVDMRAGMVHQTIQPCEVLARLQSIIPEKAKAASAAGDTPKVKVARQHCRQASIHAGHEFDRIGQMAVPELIPVYLTILVTVRSSPIHHAIGTVVAMLEEYYGITDHADPKRTKLIDGPIEAAISADPLLRQLSDDRKLEVARLPDILTAKLDRAKAKPGGPRKKNSAD